MFDHIHSQFTHQKSRNILILVIVASFVFGTASGAVSGFLVARYGSTIFHKFQDSVQILPQALKQEVKETRIVSEEEPTVRVVKTVSPAVVSIIITKDLSKAYNQTGLLPFEDFFGFQFPQAPQPKSGKQEIGGGTGFIVSSDGLIVTNKHVVADEEAEYIVIMSNGKKYPLTVVAKDPLIDVALGKVEATNLPTATFGDSDKIEIGETVIAIGNSLSEYRNTVTKGVISGRNRRVVAGGSDIGEEVIDEALQTDAAINPGNSGGPLLNLRGEVVGINTAVSREGQLIGFAIPINSVKTTIESVKKTGKIVRPYLGVRFIIITKEIATANKLAVDYGALLVRGSRPAELAVIPGGPADKAGLEENDIILEIDGTKITEEQNLAHVIRSKKPGDILALKVLHDGKEKTVVVELGELK